MQSGNSHVAGAVFIRFIISLEFSQRAGEVTTGPPQNPTATARAIWPRGRSLRGLILAEELVGAGPFVDQVLIPEGG